VGAEAALQGCLSSPARAGDHGASACVGRPSGMLEAEGLGYAAELWTRSLLARHVRREAAQAGHPSLSRAAKATVQRILAEQPLHPERVRYYLEKRDPAFEVPMRDVLLVYQEVALQNEALRAGQHLPIITVSVDEKPGLQAIANTAPDLPPVPGKHPDVARDHEYGRLGTCSILAALDLHEGHVKARVERRHRSREFIALVTPPTFPKRLKLSWLLVPIAFSTCSRPSMGRGLISWRPFSARWRAPFFAISGCNPGRNFATASCWESPKSTPHRSSIAGRNSRPQRDPMIRSFSLIANQLIERCGQYRDCENRPSAQ
jgi:hypothetical protein